MKKITVSILLFFLSQFGGIALSVLLFILIAFPQELSVGTIKQLYVEKQSIINITGMFIGQVLLFFSLYGLHYFEKQDFRKKITPGTCVLAAMLTIAAMTFIDGLTVKFGVRDLNHDFFLDIVAFPISPISIIIGAPLTEELLFRRAMLGSMVEKGLNPWVAIVTSALLFAVLHLNPAQCVGALGAGLLFGWLYVRTQSILPGLIGHMLNNLIGYIQLLLEKKGVIETSQPHISVVTLVVLAVVTAVLIRMIMLQSDSCSGKGIKI